MIKLGVDDQHRRRHEILYKYEGIAGHRYFGILYLKYRNVSPYFGTGLVPASEFLFIPVPDWLDTEQSDIPAFKKAVVGGGERDTQCTSKLQVMESDSLCTSIDSC
jgi:hypothetical protein